MDIERERSLGHITEKRERVLEKTETDSVIEAERTSEQIDEQIDIFIS